jgi:hypothetical protein
MSKFSLIQLLQTAEDESTAMLAIRQLERYLTDPAIFNLLCAFAVATDNPVLRHALLKSLDTHAEAAARRFVKYVHRSRNPRIRRWALINLALMACRTAQDAVLEGLLDGNRAVRRAAAENAGLYTETAVQSALEDFYEKHRFDLVLECLRQGIKLRGRRPAHIADRHWIAPLELTEPAA